MDVGSCCAELAVGKVRRRLEIDIELIRNDITVVVLWTAYISYVTPYGTACFNRRLQNCHKPHLTIRCVRNQTRGILRREIPFWHLFFS